MKSKKTSLTKIIVFSCLFLAALIVSLVFILNKKADSRYVFLFESLDDSELHVEIRYVNTVPDESDETCFVNELLLGPMTNRYRPLFAKGTSLRACFVRDGVLYIDLSDEALLKSGVSSETERACVLLKENIQRNFRQLSDIKVFISGIEAYKEDEGLVVTAE